MKTLEKIGVFFNKYIAYLVLAVSAIAFLLPQSFLWAVPRTTILLQIIMFGMGLTLTSNDFIMVFKKPLRVLLIAVVQFGWMPLGGFLAAKLFNLPPELAVGVILVGACPGGTASNVMTYLANGDVPLSVTATSVSTLLAPVMTPLMVSLYAGTMVEVSFMAMFMSIVKVVIIPIVGGVILNHFLNQYVAKITSLLPVISTLGVLSVLGGTVAVNAGTIRTTGLVIFAVCLVHNVSGYVIGTAMGKLFKVPEHSIRAMAIEIGMQNAGLASNLALTFFTPAAALSGAAFGIWHNFTGAVYANWKSRTDEKEALSQAAV